MPTLTPLQNGGCRTYQLLALGLLVERLVRNLRLLANTLHLGVRRALDLRMQLAILRTLQRKKGAPGQDTAGPASDARAVARTSSLSLATSANRVSTSARAASR